MTTIFGENNMEKFEGRIDEFTDWINGNHELKGFSVTDDLPVSKRSIRELICKKLKKPFYVMEDKQAGLYRLFSSEESYRIWNTDREEYSDLELFNFVRPSDYELKTDLVSDPRYIISGDDSQSGSQLVYRWEIRNDKGEYDDSVTAKYTITDSSGGEVSFSEMYSSVQKNVSLNLYEYLRDGQNTVNINLRSNSTGASFSLTIIITVLTFELTSSFDYNSKHVPGNLLQIPYVLRRNDTSHGCSIYLYIDGQQIRKVDVPINSTTEYSSAINDVINTYESSDLIHRQIQHTLQLYAETNYNNNIFRSNILYYTFETSSDDAINNYFININKSFTNVIPPISELVLYAHQYMPFTLKWGYYTDQLQNRTSIPVTWRLQYSNEDIIVGTIVANKGKESDDLTFVPNIYTLENDYAYLVAYYEQLEIARFPIVIERSSLNVYETPVYDLKLSAYGKTNSALNTTWKDIVHNAEVEFTGIRWDSNCGWYNNSFRVSGTNSYAVVDYKPLDNNPAAGRTIEVEFEIEKVVNTNDVVIQFGDNSGGHIDIMPDKAVFYDSGGMSRIYTNYKANERTKLAFILNEDNNDVDSTLLFIVNNGILERGASGAYNFFNGTGKIKIGGSESGVRVYNMRVYDRAITYTDAYNNYAYDSDNKSEIINRNNVVDQSNFQIDYGLCCNKIDTILISGDLTNILSSGKDKEGSITDVTIERFSPFDTSKNFRCEGCMARKHGQSTLNYPIASIKFWLNKSVNGAVPIFTCEGQQALGLSKNRYVMKDGCIPANKFVLQVNYADSSGVHNGSIQRLIQSSWWSTKIDNEYKLRTIPQLFTSNQVIHHNNQDLNEDNTVDGFNFENKQWNDYFNKEFPYQIEVAPNSFPCVVFYKNTAGENRNILLGQYVFMEDKKSDFNYGERSIYKADANDPFCLTIEHKNDDTDANRIWNNSQVLRMEVLNINTPFSSYMSIKDTENIDFEDIVYNNETDLPEQYRFEQDFELIYPDPDDVEGKVENGTDKFGPNSKFLSTVRPFINWYKWLVSTYQNQEKFQNEAAQHLDLYKLAAYYIIMLRLGLVDSGERNVQIKTYDGQHFHYESWDMDIALGNKNTGGIAFDPPIDRNTTLPTDNSTYAISGRSTTTSNWLWDALEAWDTWMNIIVPEVAQALYLAGFNYDNITRMFDEEYAKKWCEILYNESGFFKYVVSRMNDNSWLDWLQGARTSHRHWWLSTSMDYYDAKWGVGDFRNHFIYIAANHDGISGESGVDLITIVPSNSTYFSLYAPDNNKTLIGPIYANKNNPATIDITNLTLSNKVPRYIYGALFMEELDLSCLASRLNILRLGSAYSKVLGAPMKVLNIGTPFTQVDEYHYTGSINGFNIALITQSDTGEDTFENLQTLNMRGQREGAFNLYQNMRVLNRNQLKNFYGMGSTFSAFYSSKDGNQFDTIELPGIMKDSNDNIISQFTTLNLHNSTWSNISFWNGTIGAVQSSDEEVSSNVVTCERCNIDGNYNLDIPASLNSVTLTGSTCENSNSLAFVKKWIQCIIAREGEEGLASKTLILDGINWTEATCGTGNLLTYDDLRLLAKFNNGHNRVEDNTYKGYIVLNSSSGKLTGQQLSQIKEWFGDPVFSLNSSGLIIDQKLSYMQINVGGDAYIQDNKIYLNEGGRAILNATKFTLSEADGQIFDWGLRATNSTGSTSSVYKSLSFEYIDDVVYLKANESTQGNYAAQIVCTSTTSSTPSLITIYVIGVTYPTSINIAADQAPDSFANARNSTGACSFWKEGIISELYLNIVGNYTATITDVQITLTNDNGEKLFDNVSYKQFNTEDTGMIILDDYLSYRKYITKQYGLTLACTQVPANEEIKQYNLQMRAMYKSGRVDTTECSVSVIDDSDIILNQQDGYLYDTINSRYRALYGTSPENYRYYKSDLARITGTLTFSSSSNSFTTLRGRNGQSILKYLYNVSELRFSSCSYLLSTDNDIIGEDKRTLVFDNMKNLSILYFYYCNRLTLDFDLRNNHNLTSVTQSSYVGSSSNPISVLFPEESKVNYIRLQYPKDIALINPTVIKPSDISVEYTSKIESINLVNIPNGKSFNLLSKIMGYGTK